MGGKAGCHEKHENVQSVTWGGILLLGLTDAIFTSYAFAQGTWTTKAPMPTARTGVATGEINGQLYVMGGVSNPPPAFPLPTAYEVYDPATNTWATIASAPTSRAYAGAAGIAGKLYVVGGCINSDCNSTTNILEVFDPATNMWATKAAMPTARNEMGVGVVGGKLYVVGGITSSGGLANIVATLEVYDPATNMWTTKTSMPTARHHVGGAVINGKFYVVGGDAGGVVATLEVYDPATNMWTTKTPMPQARNVLGAGEVNGILYAVSGTLADGTTVNTVEAYDPATDSWTTMAPIPTARSSPRPQGINGVLYVAGSGSGNTPITTLEAFTPAPVAGSGTWVTKAPMPTARDGLALGEVNGILYAIGSNVVAVNEAYDPTTDSWATKAPIPNPRSLRGTNNAVVNGIVYVIGGNPTGFCSSANQAYDPATNSWTTKASMPQPSCHLSVVALNGLIYAIGGTIGFFGSGGPSPFVYIYNPATNMWTAGASMPTSRYDLAVGVVNGVLYAVGGFNNLSELNVVEAYNPVTNTWTTEAPMLTARSGLAVVETNGFLYAIGGLANSSNTYLATVEAYDPATNTWTTQASMPTARGYLAGGVVNGTLYAVGGRDSIGTLATNEAFTPAPAAGNQPPVAQDQTVTTAEDTPVAIALTGTDPDGDTLTFAVASSPAHGTLSGTPPNLTYTPALNYNGPDSFTFIVNDGTVDSAPATVSITVTPVNDPPSFTKGPDQTVSEDAGAQTVAGWATAISAGPPNESGQTLTFLVTNDNNALFSAQPSVAPNGTLTFTPAPNANGSATVTVHLRDSGGTFNTSAPQTFTITMTAVNDPPSLGLIANKTVAEDAPSQNVTITGVSPGPADEASQTVTLTATSSNTLIVPNPTISGAGASRTLTYQPLANANGTVTITVTANDGQAQNNTFSRIFTILVTPVNDPPVAGNDAATTTQGTPVTVAVLANDTDVDGDLLTVSGVTQGAHGAVVINPFTTVTYTPDANFLGTDMFTYTISDGQGGTATAGVTVTVTTQSGFVPPRPPVPQPPRPPRP